MWYNIGMTNSSCNACVDPSAVSFSGATFDSRQVKPGMLFVALKGERSDGHDYIPQAIEKGAAGIVD
jgi:UDP-N-acetylmuramyl pentapeptide synthase